MKINALYLTVFTAYKIDHLIKQVLIPIKMFTLLKLANHSILSHLQGLLADSFCLHHSVL